MENIAAGSIKDSPKPLIVDFKPTIPVVSFPKNPVVDFETFSSISALFFTTAFKLFCAFFLSSNRVLKSLLSLSPWKFFILSFKSPKAIVVLSISFSICSNPKPF